jgi:hypothetical protein
VGGKFGSTEPEDVFAPLPHITHAVRAGERMIHPSLSFAYVLVILLGPWLVLLLLLKGLRANLRNLFQSAYTTVVGGAFLGLVAFALAFYALYWARLNLFHLLGVGALVSPALVLVGRWALMDRAQFKAKGL